ncbi:MAG: hypothetical protein ACR2L2_08800 [Acidobacteriota bacterium]
MNSNDELTVYEIVEREGFWAIQKPEGLHEGCFPLLQPALVWIRHHADNAAKMYVVRIIRGDGAIEDALNFTHRRDAQQNIRPVFAGS